MKKLTKKKISQEQIEEIMSIANGCVDLCGVDDDDTRLHLADKLAEVRGYLRELIDTVTDLHPAGPDPVAELEVLNTALRKNRGVITDWFGLVTAAASKPPNHSK